MAEFSTGLQTRQEERYVIWFWLLLGGDLTLALAGPPISAKNRGGCAYPGPCT